LTLALVIGPAREEEAIRALGVVAALYGIWLGIVLLVLGLIGIVALIRELLDRSGS